MQKPKTFSNQRHEFIIFCFIADNYCAIVKFYHMLALSFFYDIDNRILI